MIDSQKGLTTKNIIKSQRGNQKILKIRKEFANKQAQANFLATMSTSQQQLDNTQIEKAKSSQSLFHKMSSHTLGLAKENKAQKMLQKHKQYAKSHSQLSQNEKQQQIKDMEQNEKKLIYYGGLDSQNNVNNHINSQNSLGSAKNNNNNNQISNFESTDNHLNSSTAIGTRQYLQNIKKYTMKSGLHKQKNVSTKHVYKTSSIENIFLDRYMGQNNPPEIQSTLQYILENKDKKQKPEVERNQYYETNQEIRSVKEFMFFYDSFKAKNTERMQKERLDLKKKITKIKELELLKHKEQQLQQQQQQQHQSLSPPCSSTLSGNNSIMEHHEKLRYQDQLQKKVLEQQKNEESLQSKYRNSIQQERPKSSTQFNKVGFTLDNVISAANNAQHNREKTFSAKINNISPDNSFQPAYNLEQFSTPKSIISGGKNQTYSQRTLKKSQSNTNLANQHYQYAYQIKQIQKKNSNNSGIFNNSSKNHSNHTTQISFARIQSAKTVNNDKKSNNNTIFSNSNAGIQQQQNQNNQNQNQNQQQQQSQKQNNYFLNCNNKSNLNTHRISTKNSSINASQQQSPKKKTKIVNILSSHNYLTNKQADRLLIELMEGRKSVAKVQQEEKEKSKLSHQNYGSQIRMSTSSMMGGVSPGKKSAIQLNQKQPLINTKNNVNAILDFNLERIIKHKNSLSSSRSQNFLNISSASNFLSPQGGIMQNDYIKNNLTLQQQQNGQKSTPTSNLNLNLNYPEIHIQNQATSLTNIIQDHDYDSPIIKINNEMGSNKDINQKNSMNNNIMRNQNLRVSNTYNENIKSVTEMNSKIEEGTPMNSNIASQNQLMLSSKGQPGNILTPSNFTQQFQKQEELENSLDRFDDNQGNDSDYGQELEQESQSQNQNQNLNQEEQEQEQQNKNLDNDNNNNNLLLNQQQQKQQSQQHLQLQNSLSFAESHIPDEDFKYSKHSSVSPKVKESKKFMKIENKIEKNIDKITKGLHVGQNDMKEENKGNKPYKCKWRKMRSQVNSDYNITELFKQHRQLNQGIKNATKKSPDSKIFCSNQNYVNFYM